MSSRSTRSNRKRGANDTSVSSIDDSKMDISLESGTTDEEAESSGSKKQKRSASLNRKERNTVIEKETIDGGVSAQSSAKKKSVSKPATKSTGKRKQKQANAKMGIVRGDYSEEEEVLVAEVAIEKEQESSDNMGNNNSSNGGNSRSNAAKGGAKGRRKEYRPTNVVAHPRQHPMAYMQELYYNPSSSFHSSSTDHHTNDGNGNTGDDGEESNDLDESMMTYHEDSFIDIDENDLPSNSSSSRNSKRNKRVVFSSLTRGGEPGEASPPMVPLEHISALPFAIQQQYYHQYYNEGSAGDRAPQYTLQNGPTAPMFLPTTLLASSIKWSHFSLFAHLVTITLHIITLSLFFTVCKMYMFNGWYDAGTHPGHTFYLITVLIRFVMMMSVLTEPPLSLLFLIIYLPLLSIHYPHYPHYNDNHDHIIITAAILLVEGVQDGYMKLKMGELSYTCHVGGNMLSMLECRVKSNFNWFLVEAAAQLVKFVDLHMRGDNIPQVVLMLSFLVTTSVQLVKAVMMPVQYLLRHASILLLNSYEASLQQCARVGL